MILVFGYVRIGKYCGGGGWLKPQYNFVVGVFDDNYQVKGI